jgi:hypothetical protein
MASRKEDQFRRTLAELLEALEEAMPPALWEDAFDHCYRFDGQGTTLCFSGPQRDDLMTRLLPWLDAEAPEVAARLREGYVPSTDTWPGPLHYPPVDHVPAPAPVSTGPRQGTLFTEKERR